VAGLPPRQVDAASGSARVCPRFTEQELRQLVVHSYRQQDLSTRQWVAHAKLGDAYSFFRRLSYGTVDKVLQHWDWYLYCLTFEATEIKDASLADDVAASMPLDLVDLQVVSNLLNVCITVSRFQEEALRFEPAQGDGPEYCIHLVDLIGKVTDTIQRIEHMEQSFEVELNNIRKSINTHIFKVGEAGQSYHITPSDADLGNSSMSTQGAAPIMSRRDLLRQIRAHLLEQCEAVRIIAGGQLLRHNRV
ncbi:unnamed protein product, partial [Prorocentrum cordatum]